MHNSKSKGQLTKVQLSSKKSMFTWGNGKMGRDVEEENRFGEMGLAMKGIG